MLIYIIEHSPESSSPFCIGGKTDKFLSRRAGFIDAGCKGSGSGSCVSSSLLSFSSLVSADSLGEFRGFVMLIIILDWDDGMDDRVDSSSTFPSIVLLTSTCVESTIAGSAVHSSGSSNGLNKFVSN